MIFHLWHEAASPVLLAMHMMYTVGGFVAPLISEPFMSKQIPVTINHTSIILQYNNSGSTNINTVLPSSSDSRNISSYIAATQLKSDSILIDNAEKVTSNYTEDNISGSAEFMSQIHHAYLIVGVYFVVVALCNIIMFTQVNQYNSCILPHKHKTLFPNRKSTCTKYTSWALFLLFNVCFGGLETSYNGFLFTFASTDVGMSISASSKLISMLFVSQSIGRFATIFAAHCVPTHIILLFDITCGLISGLTLLYFTSTSVPALWGCTILQGIGSSTIFVTALLWAKDFVPITGRFTSTYVIAYAVGMMSWPALTGFLLETVGAHWFAYMGCLLSAGCMVWFSGLWMIHCIIQQKPDQSETKQPDLIGSLHSLHAI